MRAWYNDVGSIISIQYLPPLSTVYRANNINPTNFQSTVYRAKFTPSTCGSKFVSIQCLTKHEWIKISQYVPCPLYQARI